MRSASELRMSSTCQSSGPLCHPYYYKSGGSLKFREPCPKEHFGFAHGQNRWPGIIACKQPMLLWLTKPGRPKFFLLIRDVTVTSPSSHKMEHGGKRKTTGRSLGLPGGYVIVSHSSESLLLHTRYYPLKFHLQVQPHSPKF